MNRAEDRHRPEATDQRHRQTGVSLQLIGTGRRFANESNPSSGRKYGACYVNVKSIKHLERP